MVAPCKDCKERHDICWKECDRYLRYKKEYEDAKRLMELERAQAYLERKRSARSHRIKNYRKFGK